MWEERPEAVAAGLIASDMLSPLPHAPESIHRSTGIFQEALALILRHAYKRRRDILWRSFRIRERRSQVFLWSEARENFPPPPQPSHVRGGGWLRAAEPGGGRTPHKGD